jgi:Zn-dependent peptidase ImmA (M78 family)/DNA-binding XRE family transcriptional regulator
MNAVGDVLAIARRARGITQAELAAATDVSEPDLHRWESGQDVPSRENVAALADALGITDRLLEHGSRFYGALAVEAHMRRQKTTRASVWRQLEARLNLLRLHASYLFEEISIVADQYVPTFDPDDTRPDHAARMLRTQWRMPLGPVTNLTRWLEGAGVLVFVEDFGTGRIDGLSQWVGDHPVMLINASVSADRKRLTMAHELGHLVLHSNIVAADMEEQANAFAAEFLMPGHEIRPQLRRIDLGALVELKREWGVSMQALLERAYRMQLVDADTRSRLYKTMNAKGWRVAEPGSGSAAVEVPTLASRIADTMKAKGFTDEQIAAIAGAATPATNPFRSEPRRLRAL